MSINVDCEKPKESSTVIPGNLITRSMRYTWRFLRRILEMGEGTEKENQGDYMKTLFSRFPFLLSFIK